MEPDSSLLLFAVSWPIAVHCQRQCYRLSRGPYSILPFLWNAVAIPWIAWGIMVVNTMGLRSHTLIILMYHIECTMIFRQGGGREAYYKARVWEQVKLLHLCQDSIPSAINLVLCALWKLNHTSSLYKQDLAELPSTDNILMCCTRVTFVRYTIFYTLKINVVCTDIG